MKEQLRQAKTSERAFTLVELIAVIGIMMILSAAALPLERIHAQHVKEIELRQDLREIRTAIDRYKDFADEGLISAEPDTLGYPPDLDTLVKGVPVKGQSNLKYKFLRKIPVDPMTGQTDWGQRSMQDDPNSTDWGGQNVFDVYSKSQGTGLDGTLYSSW
ncbi:MAG: type II secretion system protein [Terriglobia bacterium]